MTVMVMMKIMIGLTLRRQSVRGIMEPCFGAGER
jgi:hypothetical protein